MVRKSKIANEQLRILLAESGLSHKALARRTVDLAVVHGLRGLSYDHSSVARWLAGERPREPVPALLAEVLSAALQRRVSVADLGMPGGGAAATLGLHLAGSWPECVTTAATLWRADMDKRRFLEYSQLSLSASSVVALQWLVSPPPGPVQGSGGRRVGQADVDAIGDVISSYRDLDNRLGGGRVRRAVVQFLDTEVAPLVTDGRFSAQVGRNLARAAAELAQLAGWMAYDAGLHGHAQRYMTVALSLARHGGDSGLGGEILAAQAHQAVYLARPAQAVDLARAAQATARRAGLATLLAECYVMEAHGHAARNDARACAKALSDADAAFGRADRAEDPSWLRYFDQAYLAARMAHCFHALRESPLTERYARLSLQMDQRFVRGKAFNLSLLATALAEQGDIEQACAVGHEALTIAVALRSERSVRYLQDLHRRVRRSDTAVAQEFTSQVAQRLPAAAVPAGCR